MKLIIFALLLFFCNSCSSNNNRFRTVCFISSINQISREYVSNMTNTDPELCTHIICNVFFIDFETDEIKNEDRQQNIVKKTFEKIADVKLQNPDLKALIIIGSAEVSQFDYSAVAANQTRISSLVDNIVATIEKYKTDGIFLAFRPSRSFNDFAEALQQAFPKEKYLFTGGIDKDFDINYDVAVRMNKILDFVNLYTFSYNVDEIYLKEPQFADHHASLYGRTSHSNDSVDFTVNRWITSGFPPDKIVIGIPLYGHGWFLSSNETNPPAPIMKHRDAREIEYMPYYKICQMVRNENWQVIQDPSNKMGPYAISPINSHKFRRWIGYDDPAIAIVKANYIKEKGLGGAFVAEVTTDDFGNKCGDGYNPILTAISNTLNAPSSPRKNKIMLFDKNVLLSKIAAFVLGIIHFFSE